MTTENSILDSDPAVIRSTSRRRFRIALLVVAALVTGGIARSIASEGSDSFLVSWLPWMRETPATMYFVDTSTTALVPVTRMLSRDTTVEDFVAEFVAGPADGAGLSGVIPTNTAVTSVTLESGTLAVALTGDPTTFDSPTSREAIRQTLTSWKGVDVVSFSVGGVPVDVMDSSGHLVFFYDEQRDMLIAEPVVAREPRDVLDAFLEGPAAADLVGLPEDVELLEFEFSQDSGLLSLNFTYLPSVRAFAFDHPTAMRRVLEGLITTMTTEFPQIQGLYLDFEGHATLGLGQCADLLRTLQLQPEILNDERLLARRVA